MSEAAVITRGVMNANGSAAGSVLIIDDEAEIRESLQTLLEMEGFEVETAESGEAGLVQMAERCCQQQPIVASWTAMGASGKSPSEFKQRVLRVLDPSLRLVAG